MKRVIISLFMLSLVSILGGCGGKPSTTTETKATTSDRPTTNKTDEEVKKVENSPDINRRDR
jgi:predicted small lipoprotein YifL